ncbi:hypothetical protein SISNIDRAFT_482053 [Sistotremastrum niveocremeum HHB9708]|uniref:Uncharacterized protein n=1 Tax=Sistotremastrum niveocremeum HHB9708 TaxID=1314777 RepID=A0A164YPK7_9AGAM|nr:hypothetical protein SISNIDRAFT_482053 [Sistotremastrum niveocremeum HHB9708]
MSSGVAGNLRICLTNTAPPYRVIELTVSHTRVKDISTLRKTCTEIQMSTTYISQTLRCLNYIKELDLRLDTSLLENLDPAIDSQGFRRKIIYLQLKAFSAAHRRAQPASTIAMLDGVRKSLESSAKAVAFYSTELATDIQELSLDMGVKIMTEDLCHDIIINRLIWGVLWFVANGNAPSGPSTPERRLECSLNSSWLEDESTIYIA